MSDPIGPIPTSYQYVLQCRENLIEVPFKQLSCRGTIDKASGTHQSIGRLTVDSRAVRRGSHSRIVFGLSQLYLAPTQPSDNPLHCVMDRASDADRLFGIDDFSALSANLSRCDDASNPDPIHGGNPYAPI